MVIGKFTTAAQAARAIKSMLPDSLYEDMKKYIDTQIQSIIGGMNLVSRGEYEEQTRQLHQLREQIETLQKSTVTPQQQTKDKTQTG